MSTDLERECQAVDALLTHLGLEPDRYRTEGGSVNLTKIRAELADRAARAEPERKPLTEGEIRRCYDEAHLGINVVGQLSEFSIRVVRAIERAHGIAAAPEPKPAGETR